MENYVVMPKADYEDILDATREKTGTNSLMLSGEVGAKIRSISSGGGGDPTALAEIAEELGELAPTITMSIFDYYGDATTRSGSYRIGDEGEPVSFTNVPSITLGFVPVGTTIYVSVEGGSYYGFTDATNCTAEFDWDEYAFRIVPTAEGASVKLCDEG